MGNGASISTGHVDSAVFGLDYGCVDPSVEDICAWIETQNSGRIGSELCTRMRSSGCSAAQLFLYMDQDELFDMLEMCDLLAADEAMRKEAVTLVHAGRQALRRDFHVTLKELPDAMDKAVYVMERFPLVVDPTGHATRFLKYQRGTMLMVGNPSDMEPNSLRKHLVGALKHGTTLVINFDTLTTVELQQFFSPGSFPREVLSRQMLLKPQVYGKLLRSEQGDPEDPNDFLVNDQFKLVVLCRQSLPPKTALAMCVLHVHLPSESANDGEANDNNDVLAKALGVTKEIKRNSLELVEAAFDNALDVVQQCLEKNYDLESEDGHGHTALSEAACQGHTAIVQFLLDHGADPNKCNDEKRSPLYRTAYNGHIETLNVLLQSGADPRIITKQGETAFDVAKTPEIQAILMQWDLNMTDRLLEQRRKLIEKKWQERISTHVEREQFALRQIHQEIIDIVQAGDLDSLQSRMEQLADEAFETGERPRASADIRDERGSTLLAIAAQHDHQHIVTALTTTSKELSDQAQKAAIASGSSAQQQHAKRLAILARIWKVNVNARDSRGWTPVAIAVFHESKRSLRVLLENGGDPKLKNQYNKNAFDLAKDELDAANNIVKSHAEIRQVLIDWENERPMIPLSADPIPLIEIESSAKEKPVKTKGAKKTTSSKSSNAKVKAPASATKVTKNGAIKKK